MLLDSPEECVVGQDYINDSDLTIKLLSLFKVQLIILYQFFVDSVEGIVGMLSFIQIADGEEKRHANYVLERSGSNPEPWVLIQALKTVDIALEMVRIEQKESIISIMWVSILCTRST